MVGERWAASRVGTDNAHGGVHGCHVCPSPQGSEVALRRPGAIGKVYPLATIEDFGGDYLAVSAGAVLAGGGGVPAMGKQHGVVIDLRGASQGAKIMLAVQGVKIALEGAPTASKG